MPQEQDSHSAIWPEHMQDQQMGAGVGAEDDFSKFLDLDTDFPFSLENGNSGIDTPMGRLAFSTPVSQQPQPQTMHFEGQPMSLDLSSAADHMQFGTPQHYQPYQQQYHQVQMPPGYSVPPTPVSSEMHAAKYGQHMDGAAQLMFERQQVSFTPLVSPAQTPLTHAYGVPQYGTADDFFSPLTSPAIEAQQQAFSSARTTASPADLTAETSTKPTSAPRTSRRRKNSTSTRAATRSVKQSPVVKAQGRRRKASLTNIPPEQINQLLSQNGQQQGLPPHMLPGTADTSGDSVSPEPLSESLMRPPPVPHADRSPSGLGLKDQSGNGVTPLTLMSMPSKQVPGKGLETLTIPEDSMEDMMLPDAASPVPPDALDQMEDNSSTPTVPAKSAKTSAQSTPRGMLPKSSTSDGFNKPSKVESRPGTARGSKKRAGTTNGIVSPALRPKISPNISPLVPSSGAGMPHLSAETSALYLASKSNYQNIIDGTHLPGVSYPEALAENLSSKRTSHKIAEQGRRNRINLALKEIETLLPASITAPAIKKEKEAEGAAGKSASAAAAQGASKASTVEMAIVYIKSLQAERDEAKAERDSAMAKLAEVEKELRERGSSGGSTTSD
ncbi:Phosphorus acquisition-controlling protein [Cyphellophora attinorum]|uniref:Phosphorus acquisition-controlling protein n=1 Tax=Cyphellophora attinorum TaxID=1664694 RepID=A0A0N1H4F2_9EURO|nr:Phosphorus acquisition-controlling protein [Phialophora attinorum]KPI35575.1 Phosphorus acquisition-controlling protein [Phialophora attinorum]